MHKHHRDTQADPMFPMPKMDKVSNGLSWAIIVGFLAIALVSIILLWLI